MKYRRMKQTAFLFLLSIVAEASYIPPTSTAAVIDDSKATSAGIRKLPGKRLTLYTDLAGAKIDRLPDVFAQAFPQWCDYFKVKESDHADWHMTGFLMKDKARFIKADLLPSRLPPFEHGYSVGDTLWLYDQPSDYYRRHLLLHEGTHCFMWTVLGGCGPLWYMEGLAEYLGTHRRQDERLTLGIMPRNREEVPEWGRIRIIQEAAAKGHAPSLKKVTEFIPSPNRQTEFYAWCWAAITLLDQHPRYQKRFRTLTAFVQDEKAFKKEFHRLFDSDWPALSEEWQLMTANMEYGYDVARSAINFAPGKPIEGAAKTLSIAADRGWQNTGLQLEAGVKYKLTATGRYQVARSSAYRPSEEEGKKSSSRLSTRERPAANEVDDSESPKIWWCEPGGVSIRYYQGRPLGILLAAVRPDEPSADGDSALLKPIVVGLGTTLSPEETGTLFLKINDSAGELDDNAGELNVKVRRE